MNTKENLKELFTSEKWQDLFETLYDAMGFTLTICNEAGNDVFVPEGAEPLCRRFRSASSELEVHCENYCRPIIKRTIASGKPSLFKCHVKIVCFTLPINYMGEKAVIFGRGSFASYDDFRDCISRMNSLDVDPVRLGMPLAFTTPQNAWKVRDFVAQSVNRLLKNTQETVTLRRKFESLKSVFSTGRTGTDEQSDFVYRDAIIRISTLLDLEGVAVLTFDQEQGVFASRYTLSRNGRQAETLSISGNDEIVRELYEGKRFVLSAEPVTDPGADFLVGMGALYFFPIMVNKKIEAIVRVEDGVLKESDTDIITRFCRQTALSIENDRIIHDLSDKLNRFSAISDLTKAITGIENDKELLTIILDKSAELLKAEQASLMVFDRETDVLLIKAKKGIADSVSREWRINRGEGIAGKVAELGEPLLVENVENDPRTRQKNRKQYKTRSFVSVPLKIKDRTIGVLNLADKDDGEAFTEEDLRLIQSIATQAAIVMERNVFYNKNEELKKLTITDPLTGLLNRRYLYERLKDELARSKRHSHEMSLLMVDLDGFKSCNDTRGHLFGDQTLIVVAEALLNAVRSMDVVARYGGDEFMIILPETGKVTATDIAERVRSAVEEKVVLSRESAAFTHCALSTSVGIVCYPQHGETLELLLENADKALYRAKNKGKNRVEVFS